MITRFDDKYELDREFTAIVMEDVVYRGEDTVVKLRIPVLMPDIAEGDPGISKISCPASRLFANAKGTSPKLTDTKIIEKNYLYAKIDINSSLKPISEVSTSIDIKEYSSELALLNGEVIYDESLYKKDTISDDSEGVYEYTSERQINEESYSNNQQSSAIKKVNEANNNISNNSPSTTPSLSSSNYVYNSNNDEYLDLILEDEGGNVIYDSSDMYNTNTLNLNDEEENIIFKSQYGTPGMTFREAFEQYHYKIKKGSKVRCRFLNGKVSKLYMNTDNL